ncbi:MAG: 30S ribosomal protein S12 methylthiotransferase RimO [candidate division KSB1 bacterium]
MKINLITLGCPKNIVDSEVLQGGLKACGVEFVNDPVSAQAVIINTCGFIESAKEESIDTILQAVQLKKDGHIRQVFVTGCLSERYGSELRKEIPEVDAFYGNRDLQKIVAGLAQHLRLKYELVGERELLTPKHFAYLKISEGCEHPCTFCAIPGIRGNFRSTPIPELVAQAQSLAQKGVKELILVAQDSTQYGLDLNHQQQLPALLRALGRVEGIEWIRLMYAYPYHVTEEIIDTVASEPKVVKYIDMPVQHVTDRMLKRMARRVNRAFTEELIARMHDRIPELVLRTSLIVGFPGETEEDFQELYDFVCEGKFERLGVFTYSHEEGTPAFQFAEQVSEEVKRERYDMLLQAQRDVAAEWGAKRRSICSIAGCG